MRTAGPHPFAENFPVSPLQVRALVEDREFACGADNRAEGFAHRLSDGGPGAAADVRLADFPEQPEFLNTWKTRALTPEKNKPPPRAPSWATICSSTCTPLASKLFT